VRSEDAAPSVFFDLVARLAGTPRENDIVPVDQVDAPLSLSGHIADLRARAASPDNPADAQLAATLPKYEKFLSKTKYQYYQKRYTTLVRALKQHIAGETVLQPRKIFNEDGE